MIRSAKIVSHMLPFQEQVNVVLRDVELLEKLLLASTICAQSVVLLLQTLLESFK